MEPPIPVNGRMISNTAKVKLNLKMGKRIKDNSKTDLKKGKAHIHGQMEQSILVGGKMTRSMAKENTIGQMDDFIMENGKIIK